MCQCIRNTSNKRYYGFTCNLVVKKKYNYQQAYIEFTSIKTITIVYYTYSINIMNKL